jgi:hypothetical protein
MDQDEQQDTTAGQRIEDPRRFEEPAREVREEQGPERDEEKSESVSKAAKVH